LLARDAGARITVIAPDGRVLCDSEADPDQMENHAARPEIAAALKGNQGTSSRRSPTVGVESLYVAVPLPAGVLRLAMPLADVEQQITVLRKEMLMSMFGLHPQCWWRPCLPRGLLAPGRHYRVRRPAR
jgi:two-component system phosphate regulon sensor histidine kinase PhoR